MSLPSLQRVLRRRNAFVVEQALALSDSPLEVLDARGRHLVGTEGVSGERHPVGDPEAPVGFVVGTDGAGVLVSLLEALGEGWSERRSLATETLDRYKELNLLYELTEELSYHLDTQAIAQRVVEQAQRHLGASGASLLVHDPARHVLRVLASVGQGPAAGDELSAVSGVTARVLRTGQAEVVEDMSATEPSWLPQDSVCSLIAAPLRTGELTFGVLRVTQSISGAWGAGELKLVTALAIHAAGALGNASAHADRQRLQALRGETERLVTPQLMAALSERGPGESLASCVVALVNLGSSALHAVAGHDDDPLGRLLHRRAVATHALLGEGAIVDAPDEDLLLAVFPSSGAPPVRSAIEALGVARTDVSTLEGAAGAPFGAGLVASVFSDEQLEHTLREALGRAAELQAQSRGRLLAGPDAYRACGPACRDLLRLLSDPSGDDASHPIAYEVHL